MLKILVTYAVQGEFAEIKWPDVEVYYVRTGIGKVKAAFHLAEAIRQVEPDIVINMGTAGTINHRVGDVFVCRHFIDRDMHKLAGLGLSYELDTSALLEQKGFCRHWTESATCNTGDSFLTELTDIEGDVVDMEAYAQAFVCTSKEIPFISVKFVSDVIGQNSVKHWEDKMMWVLCCINRIEHDRKITTCRVFHTACHIEAADGETMLLILNRTSTNCDI